MGRDPREGLGRAGLGSRAGPAWKHELGLAGPGPGAMGLWALGLGLPEA